MAEKIRIRVRVDKELQVMNILEDYGWEVLYTERCIEECEIKRDKDGNSQMSVNTYVDITFERSSDISYSQEKELLKKIRELSKMSNPYKLPSKPTFESVIVKPKMDPIAYGLFLFAILGIISMIFGIFYEHIGIITAGSILSCIFVILGIYAYFIESKQYDAAKKVYDAEKKRYEANPEKYLEERMKEYHEKCELYHNWKEQTYIPLEQEVDLMAKTMYGPRVDTSLAAYSKYMSYLREAKGY